MEFEENPDLVTVIDEDGEEHTFEELDRIETDDAKYLALTPVFDYAEEILDDDGELIIVRVVENEDGPILEPIDDQAEYDEIGSIFEERLQEYYFIKDDSENNQ